jgi:hypothetical protein
VGEQLNTYNICSDSPGTGATPLSNGCACEPCEVPEPPSVLLVASGVVLLLRRIRRSTAKVTRE